MRLNTKRVDIPAALFEITNQCNLRCKHCYKDNLGREDLSFSQICTIIEKLSAFGIKHLLITGGEPLLRNDLFQIIDFAGEQNIKDVVINTNGTLLNDSKIVQELNQRLDFITSLPVSFDGASSETHDFIRGVGQFTKLMKILENEKIRDLPLEVNVTLGQWNFYEIDAFFDIYDEINAPNINFGIFIPIGYGKNLMDQVLSRDQCLSLIKSASRKLEMGYEVELCSLPYSNFFKEDISGSCCNIFTDFLTITGQGEIVPCILYDFSCGSLLESSLDDIFSTPKTQLFRNPQEMRKKMKGLCKTCPTFDSCKGGCHLLTYALEGTIFNSDQFCPFLKKL